MRGPEDMCDSHVPNSRDSNMNSERTLNKSVDFSEYMWMVEELDDFDRKCEEEFWEEYWLQEAFEEMLEEEEVLSTQYYMLPQELIEGSDPAIQEYYAQLSDIEHQLDNLNFNSTAPQTIPESIIASGDDNENSAVILSTTPLNPEAPEFIPRSLLQEPAPSEPSENADR